jgi:hypothetical protein
MCPFAILVGGMRKTKLLNVERESVCAGDDIDAPHTRRFAVAAGASLAEAISEIVVAGYLAPIAGGKATWIVETGKPVAVVAQQWKSPKFLVGPATRVTEYRRAVLRGHSSSGTGVRRHRQSYSTV